jgi:hypothetical protein
VGTALTAIAVGSATGGAVVCLVLFVMSRGAPPAAAPAAPLMPAIGPALAGGGGALAAALVGWSVSRPLASTFARAALAMMAVMGTALAAAATLPAHVLLGRPGLALLGVLCLGVIVVARRLFLTAPS